MKANALRRSSVVAAAAALALLISACGGAARHSASGATSTSRTVTTRQGRPPSSRRPERRHGHLLSRAAVCPLTGLPVPGGHVPTHAALAVKVENLPQSRPQWGLDKADIVFEEPVEGAITRFIAVYDCQSAARIEPVRSGRFDDPEILEPLGRVLFAYAGAIQPVVSEIGSRRSLLEDVGIYKAPNAFWRDPDRYAPNNLVTSTSALYAAARALGYPEQPPKPIFTYGPPSPGGTPASQVSITSPLDVTTWTWQPKVGLWYRSYSDTGPAVQGDGAQVSASNVVVMLVDNDETPWVEDDTGTHEYVLKLTGSGAAWVFRDGRQYVGHWVRPRLAGPAVFVEDDGTKIDLTPGTTWEELVPVGGTGPVETWTGSVSVKP